MAYSIRNKISELGLTPELLAQGVELLKRPRTIVEKGERKEVGPQVVIEGNRISTSETYRAENEIARHVRRILATSVEPLALPGDLWGSFVPHENQVEAINLLTRFRAAVLTGGPGTGKTTILQKGHVLFRANGKRVVQGAPTGKAANRMAEQTGVEAGTIHRLLGYNGTGWTHSASNPLPGQIFLVDEFSMVDVHLAAAFLAAIPTGARVLFVGDVDQLPSIGPGRVLHDLIASGELPVIGLTKIFRQASESRIPWVARDINEGRLPENLHATGTDVRFVQQDDVEKALDWIVHYATKVIPQAKGIATRDVQVLAAQKTKGLGVEILNNTLQNAINPTTDFELDVAISGYSARANDKVMQIRNNYDLGVMNGEQGFVLASDPRGLDMDRYPHAHTSEDAVNVSDEELDEYDGDSGDFEDFIQSVKTAKEEKRKLKKKYVLVVEFNGGSRQIAYTKTEVKELVLGYAITFHKSQGSQFPAVILIAHSCHAFMMTRQLVYTGITRAEKFALIIGQESALARAARNTRGAERRTRLQVLLREPVAVPAVSSSVSDL